MQITRSNKQFGLRSRLYYWYEDAMSVSYGHIWLTCHHWADDGLRNCTIYADAVTQNINNRIFITTDVPEIYFNSVDAADISPTLVGNHNLTAKERKSWLTFDF